MMTRRAFSRGVRRGLLRAGGGRGDLQMQTGHVWNVGQPRARTIMGICHFGVSRYVQHLWNAEAQVLKGKGGGRMPPLPIPWQLGNERANWCFRLLSPGTLQGQLRGSQQPRRVAEAAGGRGSGWQRAASGWRPGHSSVGSAGRVSSGDLATLCLAWRLGTSVTAREPSILQAFRHGFMIQRNAVLHKTTRRQSFAGTPAPPPPPERARRRNPNLTRSRPREQGFQRACEGRFRSLLFPIHCKPFLSRKKKKKK